MLKVGLIPLHDVTRPSSRYRLFQFVAPLFARGISCTVLHAPEGQWLRRVPYLPKLFRLARRSQTLFVQKRLLPRVVWSALLRCNPNIIFDLDDPIFFQPNREPLLVHALRTARAVVVGNQYLRDYAVRHNPRTLLVPTVVDTRRYSPRDNRPDGPIVIGWVGGDPNRGDFRLMGETLHWLKRRYGPEIEIRIIGRRPLSTAAPLDAHFVPWRLRQSVANIRQLDIGIMPLPDTPWNRGKCGLKLIQYMATGIPTVASPVGHNNAVVIPEETGFLAHTAEDWKRALTRLIEDGSLRRRMGRAGRARVCQHFSVRAALPALSRSLREVASARTPCL